MDTCERALKEWAVIVDALARGDQVMLLRKGGIEDVGGEFRLETDRFCLWPTYLHQDTDWLAEPYHDRLAPLLAEPRRADEYRLDTYAAVVDVMVVRDRIRLDDLASEHLWSDDYLNMRWAYRPELPLYLLVLRAYRLAEPVTLTEHAAQRGCRSWVDLTQPVSLAGMTPVLDETAFGLRAAAIRALVTQ